MRLPAAVLVTVTAVHLAAQGLSAVPDVAERAEVVSSGTQVLLMPLLAWVLLAAAPRPYGRLVGLVAVALGFSWLGDALPRFAADAPLVDAIGVRGHPVDGFLLMVLGFLGAQTAYCVAFWPWRERSALRRPLPVAVAAVALVVLLALSAESAGWLVVPVAAYAVLLVGMALLAPGVDRLAGWGGLVFVVSDAMIGLRAFDVLPVPDTALADAVGGVAVMTTYVAGQALLVAGVLRRARRTRDLSRTTPVASTRSTGGAGAR